MNSAIQGSARSGVTAGMLLAGAVCLLALPSAVLAITTSFDPDIAAPAAGERMAPIDDEAPAALSRPIPMRSLAKGQLFPFTPAGSPNRPDRSVTVAVRVSPSEAQDITVQRMRKNQNGDGDAGLLRIAPTVFSLGVSRGYKSFSQHIVPPSEDRTGKWPDVGRFSIAPGDEGDSARFNPRIVIEEKQKAGQAPRTFASDLDERVDVGGSYRVTERIDVTAGVRYSAGRDRLLPLTDGKQDSQAVYVGTQFRF
jgi:hypothetical protein